MLRFNSTVRVAGAAALASATAVGSRYFTSSRPIIPGRLTSGRSCGAPHANYCSSSGSGLPVALQQSFRWIAHSPAPAGPPAASRVVFWRGVAALSQLRTPQQGCSLIGLSQQWGTTAVQHRHMRVRGKPADEEAAKDKAAADQAAGEEASRNPKEGEEGEASGEQSQKQKQKPTGPPRRSFMDHIRGLRNDYAKFPDIYNSANAINFVIFTVFCLCSTGSNTEETWWMNHWGLDNSFRPWAWLLHSFLTNNFLSMTYAMMLLHTMCHQVLPTLGSRGLMLFCGSTAVISGAAMWLGQYLYYGAAASPEKQFGPWDIVAGLFVLEYFYYGITPFTILNSFHGWIRYACWVGGVCILYFDWQPTLVGTAVGLALFKGVPKFRGAVKPSAAA